jgi:aquaporin related protein
MSADGPSELPLHYGSKTSDGELVKRPASPAGLASPRRSYHPSNSVAYSPEERTPVDIHQNFSSFDSENPRLGSGLRRKPSNAPRRYSGGDYERERPSFPMDTSSRKALRSRDDEYYSDREGRASSLRRDEYMQHGHPDSYERSRPPRTYRNTMGYDREPPSGTKPYFEESSGEYRGGEYRDVERGRDGYNYDRKRSADEESIDGYNYDAHKRKANGQIDFKNLSKEERAEVMRLPWTQWMDSNVKNRKPSHSGPCFCSSDRRQIL